MRAPTSCSLTIKGPALKERTVSELPFGGAAIGELVELLATGGITTTAAKEVFALMLKGEGAPAQIVEARGLGKLSDQAALARTVESVLSQHPVAVRLPSLERQHPDHVQKYKAGPSGLLGFLVGQVMRATGGRADAKQVNALVRDTLAR